MAQSQLVVKKDFTVFKKILGRLMLLLVALGIFILTLFFNNATSQLEALSKDRQLFLLSQQNSGITIIRGGNTLRPQSQESLKVGDLVQTDDTAPSGALVKFSEYGEFRMASHTKVLIEDVKEKDQAEFVFRLMEGKIWLNSLYSDARLNIIADGVVIVPDQTITYMDSLNGKTLVYAHTNATFLYLVPVAYKVQGLIEKGNSKIINNLLLPQGTQATLYKEKLQNNEETLAKLLYSKLVKELQYGVFDQSIFNKDDWLKWNLSQDEMLFSKVQKENLQEIRSHGLKYSSFDSLGYKLDQTLKNSFQVLTFSEEKRRSALLSEIFTYLSDSKYLYDVGRLKEAKERLDSFKAQVKTFIGGKPANVQLLLYEKLNQEYRSLAFIKPGDSLFDLKSALLDLIEQYLPEENALSNRFGFLKDRLHSLYIFADKGEANSFKVYFDQYINELKGLLEKYPQEIRKNISLLAQQNQLLDSLFRQFPVLYKDAFFASKLLIENKYLDLLPENTDKNEEKQTMVSQRIDFLRILQEFFLDGNVSLAETIKIVFRLNREIDNIVLPNDLQVAVSELFKIRLKDFALFYRFLNSPEYVNSLTRGKTRRERFLKFSEDQKEEVSIEQVINEIKTQTKSEGFNIENLSPETLNQTSVDGSSNTSTTETSATTSNTQNSTSTESQSPSQPQPVKRVKRQ